MVDNQSIAKELYETASQLRRLATQFDYGFGFQVRESYAHDGSVMVDVSHFYFQVEMITQVAIACADNDTIMRDLVRTNSHYWMPTLCSITRAVLDDKYDLLNIPEFKTAWDSIQEEQL